MMSTLMEKPIDKAFMLYPKKLFYGKDLEDYVTNSVYDEWCRFHFPNGVKEKIVSSKLYKVWYEYKDSSDPMDNSCKYIIHYIEEAPDDVESAYDIWKKAEQKVKNYLFED